MMSAVPDMYDPRPSAPDWQTAALPTVTPRDKYATANRRRLIVLGSAGAFLLFAIGYWAMSGSDDDQTPAAAPATSAQVLRTETTEPLTEATSEATTKPPSTRPTTAKPVATQQVRVGTVLGQMQREIGVLVRADQLDRGDARALSGRLRRVSSSLRENDKEKAADRLEDFAEKLADLHDDGDISEAGFNALAGQAAQLAAGISAS
ncbi:hypothetical protein SAMN06264365_109207 [Actinoplanes regularis]|uniref:FIMAH domain-containing protein n=2 Tax=Actinoplanes regularis TaxID=52697 RepID=A0A239BGR7_9ACTN|nr:hypothetical protein SAMN06264365_109207 [Actinoplanes regularis]